MRRIFISILLASAATGCVAAEGDESFVILANLQPEIDQETGLVSFTPSLDGPFVSSALVGSNSFELAVGSMVESRVEAGEGKDSLRTIFIQGANISAEVSEVTVVDGTSVQRVGAAEVIEYQVPFSALVRPNGGLTAAVYSLLPPDVLATVKAKVASAGATGTAEAFVTVNTTTTMFGDYYGDRIDSTSFNFPVTVTSLDLTPDETP